MSPMNLIISIRFKHVCESLRCKTYSRIQKLDIKPPHINNSLKEIDSAVLNVLILDKDDKYMVNKK